MEGIRHMMSVRDTYVSIKQLANLQNAFIDVAYQTKEGFNDWVIVRLGKDEQGFYAVVLKGLGEGARASYGSADELAERARALNAFAVSHLYEVVRK